MHNIPDEVEDACYNNEWFIGESKRVQHLYRKDGSECSIKKGPALSIIRKPDGWWYHCFRCGISGFKEDNAMSVEHVEKEIKSLQEHKQYLSVPKITLPADFIQLQDHPNLNKNVPKIAYTWLWQFGIYDEPYKKYNIGWSDLYQRCIIPIYEYSSLTERDLVGWIGRDCRNLTKEERVKDKVAKYLTRKSNKYDRIYFHAPADSDVYVIVEDALSAIKVNMSCDVNAYALLTTSIPTSLLLKLIDKHIIMWLDTDQLTNMINVLARGSNLGLNVDYIHTGKDPKTYNKFEIQHKINEKR
jgi:hypothetical protein